MGKANIDPAELRRFALDLTRFNNELQALMAGLHARMRGLESTWRDQEQRKFAEAFEQTLKVLGNRRDANYPDTGSVRQERNTVGFFYTLLGHDRFGAADWD